jgi:hypothetical protein
MLANANAKQKQDHDFQCTVERLCYAHSGRGWRAEHVEWHVALL